MFRKYEKTYRIDKSGKRSLKPHQLFQLFSGNVVVEEKLDGANVGIIRHSRGFSLQKRGGIVGTSEHPQFQFFHHWANQMMWEQIMELPIGTILYGEWLRCIHTIYYDQLPDWFVSFDVWDGRKYLDRQEREVFCQQYGFSIVPLIGYGKYTLDDIEELVPERSAFGDMAEGVVVKKYHSRKGFMKGKWVRPEFWDKMDEKHWSTLPVRLNSLMGTPTTER